MDIVEPDVAADDPPFVANLITPLIHWSFFLDPEPGASMLRFR
jgi:hypothetical protein